MPLALMIWFGFIDEIGVEGPRPRKEIVHALNEARPAFSPCVGEGGVIAVELHVLAAGFVDRVTVHDSTGALDEECATSALRALKLVERGKEPATRVLLHIASTHNGARPDVFPFDELLRAFDTQRDDVDRCVRAARELDRGLSGAVLVRFVVDRGNARDVEIMKGLNATADKCIADVMPRMNFPSWRQPARAVLPLSFEKVPVDVDLRGRHTPQAPTLFRFLGCG
jgi:hypothetical protein